MIKFPKIAISFLNTCIILAALSSTPAKAVENKHVMFILDASNSMWGQIEGRSKIQIAKDVLKSQLLKLPKETKSGIIAYGHRFPKELNECDDVELVGGYNVQTERSVDDLLSYIVPKGQTPIARTLEQSIEWVKEETHEIPVTNPIVVLITDGAESCGGDPCAAAKKLADAGINTKIHVVGFGLDDQQRGQVQCIAENGNGKYFDATDASELNNALKQVEVEITQTTPEPVVPAQTTQPEPTSFFLDEFDGEALTSSWTVANSNEDAYIVENSKLLIVSSLVNGFGTKESQNIITLREQLPDGDWDLTANIKAELKTGRDSVQFGLYKDDTNFLTASIWTYNRNCNRLGLRLEKVASGQSTKFEKLFAGSSGCGFGTDTYSPAIESLAQDGAIITLSKRGKEYTATLVMSGIKDGEGPITVTTEALSSLRIPGQPALTVGKNEAADGEILAYFENVEIISIRE